MEQLITHACGHGQIHYLAGFASQQERKARWLRTTKCKTCFLDDKRSEQAEATAGASAAVAHLGACDEPDSGALAARAGGSGVGAGRS